MKYFLLAVFLFVFGYGEAQNLNPKLEVYVAPGLFFAEFNHSDPTLGGLTESSIGDVVSYAAQLALPLNNKRFTVKAGLGFSQRHYSLNKHFFDFFSTRTFLFYSAASSDTFNLTNVRFTHNYIQVPISFSYTLTKPRHNFQLAAGLNLRPDFLVRSKAQVWFDDTYKTPKPSDEMYAQQTYRDAASTIVFTAQPYVEGSFSVYKKIGLLFQFGLPAYYSSALDKRLTTSTVEIFSFTFGAFYSLK